MKQERTTAERRFWQAIKRVAVEHGRMTDWEYLGYPCSSRQVEDLMSNFHQDVHLPGFYGIRIPLGEISGLQVNMLIENQKELIIGIRVEQPENGCMGDQSYQTYQALLKRMESSQHGWNFDSPGWLAWKTPEVRLNFRAANNGAFRDMMINRDNSEALYLITEEIADIISDVSDLVRSHEKVGYGTVVN